MSNNDKAIKEQRDRFIAFAFASADMFIEVSGSGVITFAMGAVRGLTGIDEKEIIGKTWHDMVSDYDRNLIDTTESRAKPGLRCGPLLIHLSKELAGRRAIYTGIKMPGNDGFYVTLGLSNAIMSKISEALRPDDQEVLDVDNFTEAAREAIIQAKLSDQDIAVTLLDFAPTEADRRRFGEENWGKFRDMISRALVSQSYDGYTAGEIAEGRYSLLHGKDVSADELRKQISEFAQETDPTGEGVDVQSKTIDANLSSMSERNASRAIVYTIHEFERKGTNLTIETLNSGFDAYVSANAQKIKEFQNFIEQSSFNLHFQPIVDFEKDEVSHYEMLCRFEHGDTQEWVMFGEDIGLAPEFDIAVCQRAISYINFKSGGTRTKFSINVSGQSIEDDNFFEKLTNMLKPHPDLPERLMFEITESSHIQDLRKVGVFVDQLRDKGFKVALDDFGAGTASFQYLQELNVDYVKIDGKYTRKIMTSQRDVAMVKNLAQMCMDLDIQVIAEFVEELEQIELLKSLGIQYGQGYYFSKPTSQPGYTPNAKP